MKWVVRVYALISDGDGHYLVLEEEFRGAKIVKFPGGGVEPEEGLKEALIRELREELAAEVASVRHFYTTDFFQRSYYHDSARLLSVYYEVKLKQEPLPYSPRLRLFWLPPAFLNMTFPVDRYVSRLLRKVLHGVHIQSESASEGHSVYPLPLGGAPMPHE
ncbi:MAG: NUDIX hydrolase [Bacteroidia bacterium]|nr:NUDIX hydrolase [Bacteroidia bacterium]MCX7652346.1 NUDIX hydrolase [Bacteroidia bacterium]MDW8417542.1 NUDIX hydrolase [Bacteroidia bacterium]